jgi:hypothetical protein
MSRNSFPYKLDFTRVQNITSAANSVTAPKAFGPQTYGILITCSQNVVAYWGDPTAAPIASASQTVANPGVFTTTVQGLTAGTPVFLTPSVAGGALPGGFSAGTAYYVIAAGLTTTACELSATFGGTGIQVTSSAACVINPLTPASVTNGLLVKASDFAAEYGVSPGQFISVIEFTGASAGVVNIVELTH